MPDRREVLALLGVGLAAGIAGLLWSTRRAVPSGAANALRSGRFADLEGKPRSLMEWDGRVLVVNFWATWCPPCREEIPALVRTRDKMLSSGVEFIGIAIDQAAKVADFVRLVPISYPILITDAAALALVRTLGNPGGGLPFTIVLDKKGEVAHRNLGVVTQQQIEEQLKLVLAA